jgi:hypothetical protein
MPSSWTLHRVALVRTDVAEELSASIIGVTRIGELGTTLAVTSNRRTLRSVDGCAKFLFLREPHGVTSHKTPFLKVIVIHRVKVAPLRAKQSAFQSNSEPICSNC